MPARRFCCWSGFWPFLALLVVRSAVGLLAFPCFLIGLLALPLCGAAPTSLCQPQREVGKRKRLKPLILKRVPRTVAVVVHLESVPSHIQPWRQGRHTSGGAARADTQFIKPPGGFSLPRFHQFPDSSLYRCHQVRSLSRFPAFPLSRFPAFPLSRFPLPPDSPLPRCCQHNGGSDRTSNAMHRHFIRSGGSLIKAGAPRRGEADGSRCARRSRWFPWQTRPRRA